MKRILAIALTLVIVSSFPVQAQTVLQYCPNTNSRAVYWLEDLTDQTANGYNLTNIGSTSFIAGNFNKAADFGALNSTKRLTIASDLGYTGGDLSMSVWVNITTEPVDFTDYDLVRLAETTNDTITVIRYRKSSGILQIYAHRLKNGVAATTIISNQTLAIGTWHHLAYTYNGSTGMMTFYLDGVSVGTNNQTGSGITDVINAFDIGGDGVLTWVSGLEDEVVVSNSVFSSTDVMSIFSRTNPPIGCSAPLPAAEGNLWQKRSFEGKGFIATTNEITITPAAETNLALIKNPVASGKLHRSNDLALTVRTEGQNVRVRIYKNPTITANGTPVAVNNVRTSGNSPVSQVFILPTTSLPGQLIAAFSRNAGSLNRSFDLSLYLEQGESYLITVQGTATGNDYILTSTFVEE